MDESEIVLNLWYVVDNGTGYAYCLLGRAYAMTGTDEEKLEQLRQLASTDYLMAERLKVPKNFQVVLPDGSKKYGQANPADIRENIGWVYEEVYQYLESKMPPILDFSGEETVAIKQKIPQTPLMICTGLLEDEFGNITPLVENKHYL
jgi:hypothetical protein